MFLGSQTVLMLFITSHTTAASLDIQQHLILSAPSTDCSSHTNLPARGLTSPQSPVPHILLVDEALYHLICLSCLVSQTTSPHRVGLTSDTFVAFLHF